MIRIELTAEERELFVAFLDQEAADLEHGDPCQECLRIAAARVAGREPGSKSQPHLPSLREYYDMLERHDWTWVMSDDVAVVRAGRKSEEALNAVARRSPEHAALIVAWCEHVFSGPAYRCAQKPKPERPS